MISEFKSILKNSKFLYLWTSQILSQVTVNIMNFLLLARLFTITGSSIATSLLWIAYALPAIFFGPIGAASVDLVSRRKTLMITNLFQALTVFAFIFTHEQSVFLLYSVVLVYSFFNQFYVPAESASLPSVVSKSDLPQANSVFFITQQATLIIGFGLAGVVQKFLGFNGSLILCSSLLFIAFISVSFLPEMKPNKEVPENLEKLLLTFFQSILEGYRFIKGKKYILFPLLLLLGVQVAFAMIIVNLPVIATQILDVSVAYAGLLIVVPAGIGATLGSIIISRLLKRGSRKKTIIEYSLFLLAVSLLLIIFMIPVLATNVRVIVGPILVILAGAGFVGLNIPTLTFLQEATPTWLRGRVFGNLWFLITIATIFPVLFSGVITEFFGVKTLFILMAFALIFVLYYSRKHGQLMIEENFS
jgi:MFS family permease